MLIPSIDLQNNRIVQLVQGEKLAIETTDTEMWIRKFERFPKVQLIDLDAAMGKGDNDALVRRIVRECARARERVLDEHTYAHRARQVLSLLGLGATAAARA